MENKEILYLQEVERRRIAEELHDTVVQEMVYLSQQLELAFLYMDTDTVRAKLELLTARKQVRDIINDMRDTIYDLRPAAFDDIGYDAAFGRLEDTLSQSDISARFDIDNIDTSDGVTAISVYRIVCEACRNIVKHSGARSLWVTVRCILPEERIHIHIEDDGIGFDGTDSGNHFGLRFMRERVALLSGRMDISSTLASGGTCIDIDIPYMQKG